MTDIGWLPGVPRLIIKSRLGRPLLGGAHQLPVRKLLWHTTEGSTIAGAVAAYQARRGFFAGVHPHLTVDPKRREMVQHVPLNRYAYSVRDRSDKRGVIQVEVVGAATNTDIWPDERYEWLGKQVAGPIADAYGGINLWNWPEFFDDEDNISPPLASPQSPIRMTDAAFDQFSGQLGHQHAPAPDHHWDPGEWRPKVIAFAAFPTTHPIERGLPAVYDVQRDSEVSTTWAVWDAPNAEGVPQTNVRWFGIDRPGAVDKPGGAWVIHEQHSIVKHNQASNPYA